MVAIVTGTNSRRSSLAGIRLALNLFQGRSLPEFGFQLVDDVVLHYR